MNLVDNWKEAWKWFSMHALVMAGIIPTVLAELPDDLQGSHPRWVDGSHYRCYCRIRSCWPTPESE